MAQQSGERTEKATSRRRRRAKAHGQFAYSQELTSAMTLAACAAAAFYCLHSPSGFRTFFASLLQNAGTGSGSDLIRQAGTYFLMVSAPFFAVAVIAALAGNFIQGLPIFPHQAPFVKWDRLNPVRGLSRLKMQIS